MQLQFKTVVAHAVPAPPNTIDIATAVISTTPTTAKIAAVIEGAVTQAAAPTAAETFRQASK